MPDDSIQADQSTVALGAVPIASNITPPVDPSVTDGSQLLPVAKILPY